MSIINFANINSATVPLALTTSSANVALPQNLTGMVVISNIGTAAAFVASGDSGVTATASTGNNMCVPSGQTLHFRISPRDTHIAGVTATGTSTLSISVVNGGVFA